MSEREGEGEGERWDGTGSHEEPVDPATVGEVGAPPVEEQPYKVVFEANACIGTGRCAAVSGNWELDLSTGIARPRSFFFGEDELAGNLRAAEECPAKKGAGVIHVVDRRSGEELAPDPRGDGTLSVDW